MTNKSSLLFYLLLFVFTGCLILFEWKTGHSSINYILPLCFSVPLLGHSIKYFITNEKLKNTVIQFIFAPYAAFVIIFVLVKVIFYK